MSFTDDQILPGSMYTFGTNAENEDHLNTIKKALETVDHITEIKLHNDEFPKAFSIMTDILLPVDTVQKKVIEAGFHAIPKEGFSL